MLREIRQSTSIFDIFESIGCKWFQKATNRSLHDISSNTDDIYVNGFVALYKDISSPAIINDTHKVLKRSVISQIPPLNDFLAPKNPIVLCHGLSGFDRLILIPSISQLLLMIRNSMNTDDINNFMEFDENIHDGLIEVDYWNGIRGRLEDKGCTVFTAKVPSFGCIEERAMALNEFIEKETSRLKKDHRKSDIYNNKDNQSIKANIPFDEGDKIKLNLISHSMGGLDARYMIALIPNKNYEVASLTTISTPHHGSEMANYVVDQFQDFKQNSILKDTPSLLPKCIYQLTTYYMKYFNATVPDDSKVAYYSYGCYFVPKWYNFFYPTWHIVYKLSNGEPNDGMVTVKSSKWGQYMYTLSNTDHMDIINWKNQMEMDFSQLVPSFDDKPRLKIEPKIDAINFYLMIVNDLAQKGF